MVQHYKKSGMNWRRSAILAALWIALGGSPQVVAGPIPSKFCNALLSGHNYRHELIVTERLYLQPLDVSNAQEVYEMISDPRNLEMSGSRVSMIALVQSLQFPKIKRGKDPWDVIWIGVRLKETEELIGAVQIHREDFEDQTAIIGYSFAHEHWGRGYASETVQAIADYVLEDLGMSSVLADVIESNVGSQRVLEKSGFENLGIGYVEYRGKTRTMIFFRKSDEP